MPAQGVPAARCGRECTITGAAARWVSLRAQPILQVQRGDVGWVEPRPEPAAALPFHPTRRHSVSRPSRRYRPREPLAPAPLLHQRAARMEAAATGRNVRGSRIALRRVTSRIAFPGSGVSTDASARGIRGGWIAEQRIDQRLLDKAAEVNAATSVAGWYPPPRVVADEQIGQPRDRVAVPPTEFRICARTETSSAGVVRRTPRCAAAAPGRVRCRWLALAADNSPDLPLAVSAEMRFGSKSPIPDLAVARTRRCPARPSGRDARCFAHALAQISEREMQV